MVANLFYELLTSAPNIHPSTHAFTTIYFSRFIAILTLVNFFLLTLTFLNNLHQNLQPSTFRGFIPMLIYDKNFNNLFQNLQPSTFRAFIPILTLFNVFLLTLTFLNNLHQNLQTSTFRAL